MLRFIEDDRELQMIIAHELAHNIEGHIEKKSNNFILGTTTATGASSGDLTVDAAVLVVSGIKIQNIDLS